MVKNWKVKTKLISFFSLIILLLSLVFIIFSVIQFRDKVYEEKREKLVNLIDVVDSTVNQYYSRAIAGEFTEEEAKKRVLKIINKMRFDKTNYFFIGTHDVRMVLHPLSPGLNGKDISNLKDSNGVVIKTTNNINLFVDMARIAKKFGKGYVEYRWPRTRGSQEYVPKLSYVKNFGKWKWVIGAGVYIDDIQSYINSFIISVIVIFLIVAGISIFLSILFARSLSVPIKAVTDVAESISNRDLSKPIELADRKDEIGILAGAMNVMQINLIEIIRDMTDIASSLAASSEEISSSAGSLSQGAQNQAAGVEETSASMEEFSASVGQVSVNIEEVNDKAKNQLNIAQDSSEIIESAIKSMDEINESSQQIAEILGIINDISDQTNLLALNAAIEAARAGEHGRGFAVVADEISKLADKSAENAKEIEKLIKQNIKDLTTGTEIVKESSGAFNRIIEGVNENSSLMNGITQAVGQQTKGVTEVQKAIEDINEITQSTSASAEELAASTEELQSQAEKIRLMFDQFIVPELNEVKVQNYNEENK